MGLSDLLSVISLAVERERVSLSAMPVLKAITYRGPLPVKKRPQL